MARPKDGESAFKQTVMEFCRSIGAMVEVLPTGTFRGINGQAVYRFGQNGRADLIGAYRGIPIAIETKGAEEYTADQILWGIQWENAGGLWIKAKKIDDVSKPLLNLALGG